MSLSCSILVCAAGCHVDRFNHLHTPANLEKVTAAGELFDAVRSKRTGIPAQMLANLETQLSLRKTVSNTSVDFFDLTNIHMVNDISWGVFRNQLYQQLGYSTSAPRGATMDHATVHRLMRHRLALLEKAVRVYGVLVAGERANIALFKNIQGELVKKAEADFKVGAKKPGAAGSPGASAPGAGEQPATRTETVIDLLFELKTVISNYWSNEATRKEYLEHATELERLLLSTADRSRDPASVYSLVPLAGYGLDDAGLKTFEKYLDTIETAFSADRSRELKAQLEWAEKNAPETTEALSDFATAWTAMQDALRGVKLDAIEDNKLLDNLSTLLSGVAKASDKMSIELDLLKARKAAELAKDLQKPVGTLINTAATGSIDPDAVNTLISFALGPKRLNKLNDQLDKAISDDTIKAVTDALAAAAKQDQNSSKRVVELIAAVYKLHQQMHEENVRHFLSLSSIATSEIDRWKTNWELFREIQPAFSPRPHPASVPAFMRPLVPHAAPATAHVFQSARDNSFPSVTLEHDVFGTLQRLAGHASELHKQIPASNNQWQTDVQEKAVSRLARALQIVQAFELITTVNRRRAEENSIALIGEVDEHSIHLDDILTTGVELDIRYRLDELIAFHATGITEGDLRLVVSIVQSGILAWIGERQ